MKTVTAIFLTWLICLAAGAANARDVTYQTFGNLTYGSDGSRFNTIGNRTFAKYPEPVDQGGLDANIILDATRNLPNYGETILRGQAIAAQREQENLIAEQEARIQELEEQAEIRAYSEHKQAELNAAASGKQPLGSLARQKIGWANFLRKNSSFSEDDIKMLVERDCGQGQCAFAEVYYNQ